MAQRLRVAALGEVGEDLYLPGGVGRLGGISANFARAAACAGAHAALFSAVGDDPRGARLATLIEGAGLHEVHLRVRAGRTALQRIRVASNGERVFCGYDPGVLSTHRLTAGECRALRSFDVLALVAAPETRRLFEQGLAVQGVRRVADFSADSVEGSADRPDRWVEPYAGRLDVAFVGGTALHVAPLRELSRRVQTLVVLTAGPEGAWVFEAGRATYQPSVATRIVDTTGCGDALQGVFTARLFGGASPRDALRAGAQRAAIVAARLGA